MASTVNLEIAIHQRQHAITSYIYDQGGGTPIDSVLQAVTAVKILTDKIFIIALATLILRLWIFFLKFA